MSSWEVIAGDNLETLRGMPACSVDAVVMDPPYGLGKEPDALAMLRDWLDTGHHDVTGTGFMGRKWDAFVPQPVLWRECLRVLKPGGHLLSFGGTRTYDLIVLGLRIAGFEIRDEIACLLWTYATGFPKSLDVSKAIDAAAGAAREVVGYDAVKAVQQTPKIGTSVLGDFSGNAGDITAPASAASEQWVGWGTSLKPAHEPVVVARKPLDGTVATNVQEHGTGGVNVDGCRVPGAKPVTIRGAGGQHGITSPRRAQGRIEDDGKGRWPPNLLLVHHPDCTEECVPGCHVLEMGAQSGASGGMGSVRGDEPSAAVEHDGITGERGRVSFSRHADEGTAARFFPQFRYEAKPSRAERDAGITRAPVTGAEAVGRAEGSAGLASPRAGAGRTADKVANRHPTVKPISLMRWLVKLVTPPGGVVLDPYCGSGTTGCGCVLEGFDFIGCDAEAYYVTLSRERIAFWAKADPNRTTVPKATPTPEGQGTLF